MNASQNVKSGSSLEQQLSSVSLPDHVRAAALHDAKVAETIVDAVLWVAGKLGRRGGRTFTKLSPKY